MKFLPDDQNLDQSKFKAFADNKFQVAKMPRFVHDGIKIIGRKGENAGNQHFLLFPQCFNRLLSMGC